MRAFNPNPLKRRFVVTQNSQRISIHVRSGVA
jgi:ribosomal protein L28